MQSIFDDQADFLAAGDVPIANPTTELQDLSVNLIEEECEEFLAEPPYFPGSITNINDLKECIDLIYVAAQYMNIQVGPEKAQRLFNAVHTNNMSKCIEGKLVKRDDGKILKPPGFDKNGWLPEFEEIVRD